MYQLAVDQTRVISHDPGLDRDHPCFKTNP
jgi:hypothetical protein